MADLTANDPTTTDGISVELTPDGLWVQYGSSPDEWHCVFVPASDLNRLLDGRRSALSPTPNQYGEAENSDRPSMEGGKDADSGRFGLWRLLRVFF